jgi:oligopeptide transport system permease protein
MFGYIFKRLIEMVPVLFIVVSLTFVFMRMAPGGPFDSEKAAPAEVIKALNEKYKFNAPLHEQYFHFIKDLMRGDFGPSFKHPGRSVVVMISEGLPRTVELALYSILFALILGVFSGVLGAIERNTWLDYLPMSLSMVGICVPSFLLGPLMVLVLGIWLHWLPIAGWDDGFAYKILPTITLGSAYAAYIARLSRGGMLEILSQDFIRTARAKGVPEKQVITKHALKGGLLPVVSFLGPALAGLLGGSFVTETIFQIPGIGRFYVEAAFNRDYTLITGTTILFALFFVVFNLFSDVITVLLNPKLSFAKDRK